MLLMIALFKRGVKLASDFRSGAELKQRYQHLHVVENDCSVFITTESKNMGTRQ